MVEPENIESIGDDMTLDGLTTLVQLNDEKHEEGHARLRHDLRALQRTVESNYKYFDDISKLRQIDIDRLTAQINTPIDATKLVLSTKVVVAIVIAALSIAASIWGATGGLRSDFAKLSGEYEREKEARIATAKIQELQNISLQNAINDAKTSAADGKRQYELLRYEFQALKDTVLGIKAKQ